MKTIPKPPYTPTQGRYLAFIKAYTDGYGLPPAESDIAAALKVSPPSVNQMMKTLQAKGFIERQPGVPRSIEILIPDELPKWKGKMPPRIVRQWVYVGPPTVATKQSATIYRFRITLRDSQPAIYRVIETKDVSIERFHELIQTAMGWTNSHLHQFEVDGEQFTDPRFLDNGFEDFGAVDYQGLNLSNWIRPDTKQWKAVYEYDFGDGWMHDIELEGQSDVQSGVKYPRCVEGSRACPPEDIGGVWGFADYVRAITDPSDEEYEHYMEWNGPFDPEAFSTSAATRRMRTRLPQW
ncbi:MAG: MarR family transcriptional regulator [Planctomycetaceae bacterium]